jgi:beta-1,4-mannosyl-glycoprotein beta-1,4-N-acetylglucosaminyltransferase
MIIDCFGFYNELKMLEFRLEEYYDYVDYFVIVESNLTHSGIEKPYYYEENKEKFKKFSSKIIHVKKELPKNISENLSDDEYYKILGEPEWPNMNKINELQRLKNQNLFFWGPFIREALQRDAMIEGINKVNPKENDIIFISDVDEIIDVELIKIISDNNSSRILNYKFPLSGVYNIYQRMYYYDVECVLNAPWNFFKICDYKTLLNKKSCSSIKWNDVDGNLGYYGWHFSFFGGPEQIMKKLNGYLHQEYNNEEINNEKNIQEKINKKLDVLGRDSGITGKFLTHIPFNREKYWPKKIDLLIELYELQINK